MSKPDWKVGHVRRVEVVTRLLEQGVARCRLALDEARTVPPDDKAVDSWFRDMLIIARRINVESQRPPGVGEGP